MADMLNKMKKRMDDRAGSLLKQNTGVMTPRASSLQKPVVGPVDDKSTISTDAMKGETPMVGGFDVGGTGMAGGLTVGDDTTNFGNFINSSLT